jgi:hypothetical protein
VVIQTFFGPPQALQPSEQGSGLTAPRGPRCQIGIEPAGVSGRCRSNQSALLFRACLTTTSVAARVAPYIAIWSTLWLLDNTVTM